MSLKPLNTNGNQRRRSRFTLVKPRHLWPVLAGALCATIVLHMLGFTLLNLFGAGLKVFSSTKDLDDVEIPVVIASEEEPEVEPVVKPPEQEPVEVIPMEDIKMPDPEDLAFEELTIAPGETAIAFPDDTQDALAQLNTDMGELNIKTLKQGMGDPGFTEVLAVTDNPVKIVSADQPSDLDPDKWFEDRLKGAAGNDEATLKDGSKTLAELLAMGPNQLGKDSGFSRLGADLLFEYNAAALKNSAYIGLLKLAALIYKNPETTFIIEGHTDSFGSKEYNTLLSLMRANAVRIWLAENGIDLKRVYIRACADNSPIVPTSGDKNQQSLNRRVEIHMRKKNEALPSGSLPASYNVDMKTPIAKQLGGGNVELPTAGDTVQPSGNAPKPSPAATPKPKEENIPDAIPVEEENIPDALPL